VGFAGMALQGGVTSQGFSTLISTYSMALRTP
jgi:hypothetical protein